MLAQLVEPLEREKVLLASLAKADGDKWAFKLLDDNDHDEFHHFFLQLQVP